MNDIIERAEAALEGTTPGPWEPIYHQHDTSYPSDTYNVITELTGDLVAEVDDESRGYEEPHGDFGRDAHFIAAARTLVPDLVAALKSARAELAQAVEDWGANDELVLAENARLADELKAARAENDRLRELANTMANENGMCWNSITARRIRELLDGSRD